MQLRSWLAAPGNQRVVVGHVLEALALDGSEAAQHCRVAAAGDQMIIKVLEFRREDWRDAAKTLRKIADDLDAAEHPECTVGALTLIGAKGEVTVFGLGPKCDDL